MKCPMEPDLLPLLLPDGLPIAVAGSSIAAIGWGWEAKGRWWRKRGRAKARGKPNRRRAKAASWIGGDGGLGEATVRKRLREREERVRELMLWVFMRENGY